MLARHIQAGPIRSYFKPGTENYVRCMPLKKVEQKADNNVSVFGPGVSHVPGGSEYNNRSVMSWHWYCGFDGYQSDDSSLSSVIAQFVCDAILAPDVFRTVEIRTAEIGGGSMLTEVQNSFLIQLIWRPYVLSSESYFTGQISTMFSPTIRLSPTTSIRLLPTHQVDCHSIFF
jgi:hypothetical protein